MKQIHKKVSVPATLSEVWRAWSTAEGARTFFAPEASIDLRPGGRYEILFFPDNPPGQRGAEGVKLLSFLPDRMLSFEWNAPPQFPTVRQEKTWVVLQFASVGAGLVSVELWHLGWGEGSEWEQVYDYFLTAWGVVLRRLELRFSEGPLDWHLIESQVAAGSEASSAARRGKMFQNSQSR